MLRFIVASLLAVYPIAAAAQGLGQEGDLKFKGADTPATGHWRITYTLTKRSGVSSNASTMSKGGNRHLPLCVPHFPCDHLAECHEGTPDIDPRSNQFTFEVTDAQSVAKTIEASISATISASIPVTGGTLGGSITSTLKVGEIVTASLSQKVGQTMGLTGTRLKCKSTTVKMHWAVSISAVLVQVYDVVVECWSNASGLVTVETKRTLTAASLEDPVPDVLGVQDPPDYGDPAQDCRCEELYASAAAVEVPSNGGQFAYVTAGGYAVELVNHTGRQTLVGTIPGSMRDAGGLNYTTMTSNLTPTSTGTLSGEQVPAAVGQGGGQTTAYVAGGSTASTSGLAPGGVYFWQTPAYQNSMANLQNSPGYYANTPGYQNTMSYIQNAPGYFANMPADQNSPLSGLPPSLVVPALTVPAVQQFFGITPGGSSPRTP